MIIKDFQLNKIISENNNFLCLLLYGPNEGLIREQINKIIKHINSKHDFEPISLSGKEIDEDDCAIDTSLKTVSMFYKGKILVLETIRDKHLPIIEQVIEDIPDQSVLIIKSENLTKSSKIRKFFENHKLCYALACYEDDRKSLIQNLESFILKYNLQIRRDVKNYLIQSLSNDRMINNNELEKISLYIANSEKELTLAEAKFLLNDSSSQNLNRMNENVMNGNTLKSSKIIHKLLSEGSSPISLVRSLMNYLIRIQKTKIEMKKGNNFDSAIQTLKPPLFWKDKENFQSHCLKWPLQSIESNLSKLIEAEISCKLNSKLASLNCEKSILLIADRGKQYFKT